MTYLIWNAIIEDGYCVCLSLEGFDNAHKLKRGSSVAKEFPDDAIFRMDPDFPKDIMLSDNVRNLGGFVLVSGKLKDILYDLCDDHIEYLPVSIINHKGRVADRNYCIVNPLRIYDAIDIEASELQWNSINPDLISSCKRLVLRESEISPETRMFRVTHLARRVIVRSDLVEEIMNRGFKGVAFTNVDDFQGF